MGNFLEPDKTSEFADNGVHAAEEPPSPLGGDTTDVEAKLTGIWEELFEKSPIGRRDDFFDLGGTSLLAVQAHVKIEAVFNKKLPITALFDAPTIEQLARLLGSEATPSVASHPPLFCIPTLPNLARHLGPEQPFHGLNFPPPAVLAQADTTVEGIAADCVRQIRAIQDKGPYYLAGFSFGGVVAFEVSRQLTEQHNEEVAALAMLDPDPPRPYPVHSATFQVRRYSYHLRRLTTLNPVEQLRYLLRSVRKGITRHAPRLFPAGNEPELEEQIFVELTTAVHERYHAESYPGPLTLFLARDTQWRRWFPEDPRSEWFNHAKGQVELCEISGQHDDFYKEPHVDAVAEKLAACLAAASRMNGPLPPGRD